MKTLLRLMAAWMLLLALPAAAQVTLISSGNVTASSASITVPSGTNRMLNVSIGIEYFGTGTEICTITLNSVSLTQVTGSPANNTDGHAVFSYYMLESSIPATGSRTLATTCSGSSGGNQGLLVTYGFFGGVAQSAPGYGQNVPSSGTAPNITGLVVTSGGAIFGGCIDGGGGVAYTVPSGWTSIYNGAGNGGDTDGLTVYQLFSSGTTTSVQFLIPGGGGQASGAGAMIMAQFSGGASPVSGRRPLNFQ